ncbi:hypothetical protein DevBK_20190 [Devosia sp. BK]|nr:hypothetical protein [Devosia sp. BK]
MFLVTPVLNATLQVVDPILPDPLAVRLAYFRTFKRWPNLSNPATFNEKIAWRKLHERLPLMQKYVDKLQVKDLISDKFGDRIVIPTLASASSAEELPLENIDAPYIVKT